ncbi:MAG: S8 family serine peptidase [Synergistaceae bacterium]|jgi:subtilisin family serine protease|nr:S8 family serine peptidase [Synergistaceae bacterium]
MKDVPSRIRRSGNIKPRVILIVFALLLSFAAAAFGAEYVEGEAIVMLRNGARAAGADARSYVSRVSRRAGAEEAVTYDALSAETGNIFALVKSETESTLSLIERLKSDPDVISASPNYITRVSKVPNDATFTEAGGAIAKKWGLERIKAPSAWDDSSGGKNKYVVVMDTGVHSTHEDISGNFESEGYSVNLSGDPPSPGNDYQDTSGHGTHVAGTIGAVGNNALGTSGVNWATNIIAVKLMDTGSMADTNEIAGYSHVLGLINSGVDIAAVNMSYGGYYPVSPQQCINDRDPKYEALKALAARTVVVVAAGNEGIEVGAPAPSDNEELYVTKGDYNYPPSYIDIPNMIVVGATGGDLADPNDPNGLWPNDNAAVFTGWSERFVDILAPGVNIWSTYFDKDKTDNSSSYQFENGTSMAAPHVTGAVTLLASLHPDWAPADLKRIILLAADDVIPTTILGSFTSKPNDGRPISAHGVLDVSSAVNFKGADEVEINQPGPLTLSADYTISISATVRPQDATSHKIIWESLTPSIATVDENGVIKGLSSGEAVIRAYAAAYLPGTIQKSDEIKILVSAATSGGTSGGGGGGGGCSAGYGAGILLLAGSALFVRIRRAG